MLSSEMKVYTFDTVVSVAARVSVTALVDRVGVDQHLLEVPLVA